ncbi:helix-turn-helix domain-containing protein [Bacteroides sp.]|uniref:hybrid sensor histidine kinase/response regulator transcription factor n=1 Tax=Bacteroides TaxID=816 RepID=UPI002A83A1CB|nr:helix-turn-helix domain-containing protein [Bacteroides sp.]
METFNFNLFLNLVLPLQEGYMPGGTDVTQEPELLLSSLSLLGYAIPLEGSVMVFFLLLGVYILGRNIRLSPQEKVHAAISMGHWVHLPLILIRNILEEIVTGGVPGETCRMLESVLEYAECAIVYNQNIIELDRMGWKKMTEASTTEVEIHRYLHMTLVRCRSYASSHHVRLEISHSKGQTGCRLNESFMAVALQQLLDKMIDITAPGGCIYLTISHNMEFWKLHVTNDKQMKKGPAVSMFHQLTSGRLRTVRKIIRLHGGKMTIRRYGKSATCRIVVPTSCCNQKKMESNSDIFFRKWMGQSGVTDYSGKECISIEGKCPYVLLVMADNIFGDYLQTTLSKEFKISFQETLDIQLLASAREKPDAIIIDENVNGICGDELCSRIKAEEMTAFIPVILLVEDSDGKSYLSHAKSGANRLEPRTISICRLKTDIHMLINSYMLLCKQVDNFSADTAHMLHKIKGESDDNLSFLNKVRQLIEENLAMQGYTIDMLCAGMGMSRTSFYNKMKELTGKYPMEYMLTFKMERAKVLLASGQYNVTETAEMLGYCDSKYFSKKFKDFYHVSPTKFMKGE